MVLPFAFFFIAPAWGELSDDVQEVEEATERPSPAVQEEEEAPAEEETKHREREVPQHTWTMLPSFSWETWVKLAFVGCILAVAYKIEWDKGIAGKELEEQLKKGKVLRKDAEDAWQCALDLNSYESVNLLWKQRADLPLPASSRRGMLS